MTNDEDIINMASINNIKKLQRPNVPNLIHRVIDIFASEASGRMQEMEQALQAKDFVQVGFIAHALKSSSGNLGAFRLSSVCEQLEKQSKNGNFDEIEKIMPSFKDEYEKAQDALIKIKAES